MGGANIYLMIAAWVLAFSALYLVITAYKKKSK